MERGRGHRDRPSFLDDKRSFIGRLRALPAIFRRRITGFERFDLIMAFVIAALSVLIGIVLFGGDRAGVGITLLDPATDLPANDALTIHTTTALKFRFSDLMDDASVHLHFEPNLDADLSWSGSILIFIPRAGFAPGHDYQVTLAPGAQSQAGRAVQGQAAWHFGVAPLSIVYLAPAVRAKASVPTNLWRVDPPGEPVQITFAQYGVDDFAPSSDGTRIAFSQRDVAGKTDLYLFTVATHAIRPLTQCVDAPCRAPAWSPDGTRLVYERADSTRPDSDTRAWLLDLSTLQTTPLLSDSRWLGKAPHWSPDGKTISFYDRNAGSLTLVDMATGTLSPIQTLEDNAGAFAPRGQTQIVYQELIMTASGAMRRLSLADYNAHTLRPLVSPDGALTDDPVTVWNPDGIHLAVMRRYFDDRATNGSQVYEVDTTTGDAVPLVIDPDYVHGYLSWSPDGGQLLMQRFPLMEPNGQTGIWVYEGSSKRLTKVAENGFFPQWLP